MSKIYTAGPMTPTRFDEEDRSDHKYEHFFVAERRLTEAGHIVYNPATNKVNGVEDPTYTPRTPEEWAEFGPQEYTKAYREVMERDIRWILECDGVALLPGWRKSQGAMFEHGIAAFLHKEITNVDEWVEKGKDEQRSRYVFHDIGESPDSRPGEGPTDPDAVIRAEGQLEQPHYGGDAGYDLTCSEDRFLGAGEFCDVPCYLRVALPPGTWGLITGRSSTFRNKGIHVVQGVVDNGYRGDVRVGCWNAIGQEVKIEAGEQLAQLIVMPLLRFPIEHGPVPSTSPDGRGEKGFGSTS